MFGYRTFHTMLHIVLFSSLFYCLDFLFLSITGRPEQPNDLNLLQRAAVFLANLFHLTSDTYAPVIFSNDLSEEVLQHRNVITLGTDSCHERMPLKKLVSFTKDSVKIGKIPRYVYLFISCKVTREK